jgi:hypothetical protein
MNIEEKRKRHREYMRKYNATEKGKLYNRRHVKRWRKENPELRAIQMKKESTMDKVYNQHKHLKAKFGMSIETYNQMFQDQNGTCAICNKHQTELTKRLSVDHCHKTDKIRQLLCSQCNTLLGMSQDNEMVLQSAIAYLRKHTNG